MVGVRTLTMRGRFGGANANRGVLDISLDSIMLG
jgi:hypothetical protein